MSFPGLDALSMAAYGAPFPLEDSQFFMDTPIDPSMKKETDGGLIFTRKQYTRDPGKHFVTGFTSLEHKYKTLLDSFYKSVGGGSYYFDYVHPLDGNTISVRFEDPYTLLYKGVANYKVWDITAIKLRTI